VTGINVAVFAAHSELRKVLFLALSVTFLFVYEMSREPLNGYAPNSHGIRIWSLVRTSLKVKAKGQRSRSPGTKMAFRPFGRAACVRFMFGKTSIASSLSFVCCKNIESAVYDWRFTATRCVSASPFPQIDIIRTVVIVWRVRGKTIRSVLCNILCATIVHSACTHI